MMIVKYKTKHGCLLQVHGYTSSLWYRRSCGELLVALSENVLLLLSLILPEQEHP